MWHKLPGGLQLSGEALAQIASVLSAEVSGVDLDVEVRVAG